MFLQSLSNIFHQTIQTGSIHHNKVGQARPRVSFVNNKLGPSLCSDEYAERCNSALYAEFKLSISWPHFKHKSQKMCDQEMIGEGVHACVKYPQIFGLHMIEVHRNAQNFFFKRDYCSRHLTPLKRYEMYKVQSHKSSSGNIIIKMPQRQAKPMKFSSINSNNKILT